VQWILFGLGLIIGVAIGYFYQRSPKHERIIPALVKLERQITTWKHIVQESPIGYLQVDEENHLFFWNGQARQLLGIEIEMGVEKKLLLQIVRSYELDRLIEETRTTNVASQKEWIFHPTVADPLHPVEKEDIPIKAYSLPLRNGHVGIFIENRLEAITLANQRDRWAADVAHDLKTPLTSIRLIAESLQERVDPALQIWVKTLVQQTIRLSDLVQDILDLGQVEMGMPLKLNLKPVDLPKIIQSAWNSLEPLATSKQIKLEHYGTSDLTLVADESKVYRLLLNILDNSIKHSPPLQIISIKVGLVKTKTQKIIVLEVIDSGSGFAKTALPHVFDRFYQSAQPQMPLGDNQGFTQGGSGLGLAIARQIVKSHKGTITVDNHPETGGAWVKVTLPTSQT
jgi:two-component system, OmpR family, phosphate regulon sensor histidine kinase PhoR